MTKVADLSANLVADTAYWDSGLGRARSQMNQTEVAINRNLKRIDAGFAGMGKGVSGITANLLSLRGAFGAAVGTFAITSLGQMARQALETVGGLGELASQLGVTTELLQVLTYAGTQYGVSTEQVQTSLAKFTDTIGKAAEGNKSALDLFNRLGVSILDVNGKVRSTDAVFRDFVQAISEIKDPARQAALAKEAMGKAAQKMMPLLQGGTAALDDMARKAHELGLIFSDETIAKADEAADHLATVSMVLKTQFSAMLVDLAPLLTSIADKMAVVARAIREIYDAAGRGSQKNDLLQEFQDAESQLKSFLKEKDQKTEQYKRFEGSKLNLYPEEEYKADMARLDLSIADATQRLRKAKSDFEQAIGGQGPDINERYKRGLTIIPPAAAAIGNPPATGGGPSEAEKNIDRMKDKLRDLNAQLADLNNEGTINEGLAAMMAGFDLSSDAAMRLAEQIREVVRQLNSQKQANDQNKADAEELYKVYEDAERRRNAALEEGKQLTEAMRTPTEVYYQTLDKLRGMLDASTISQSTFDRAVASAKTTMEDSEDQASTYRSAMADLGATFGSAFEEAVVGMRNAKSASEALGNALEGLLEDILRIITRLAITDPLAEGASSLFKSIDWGGLWGSIFGSSNYNGAYGGQYGIGTVGGSGMLGHAAEGGYVRVGENGPERFYPGVSGLIMPQGGDGGPSGVVFNLIDQRSADSPPVQASQKQGPDGQSQIDAIVRESFNRQAARGAMDPAMTRWGMRPQANKPRG